MAARRLSGRHTRSLQWFATDHQCTRGMLTSSHQDLVRALPGDQGNISPRLHTLEARGLIVIGRSSAGKLKPCGSLRRDSNGLHNLREVVIKGNPV